MVWTLLSLAERKPLAPSGWPPRCSVWAFVVPHLEVALHILARNLIANTF